MDDITGVINLARNIFLGFVLLFLLGLGGWFLLKRNSQMKGD